MSFLPPLVCFLKIESINIGSRTSLGCSDPKITKFDFLSFQNIKSFVILTFNKTVILEVSRTGTINLVYDQMFIA